MEILAFYVPQIGHKNYVPQMGYKWGTKWGAEVNLLVEHRDTGFLCTPKWGTKTMYPKWGTNGVQNGVHNGVQRGSRGEFVS